MSQIQASPLKASQQGGALAAKAICAAGQPWLKAQGVLRFTPSQWRAILESDDFLNRPDNCFQHPRRFQGARVQIIPDESFR